MNFETIKTEFLRKFPTKYSNEFKKAVDETVNLQDLIETVAAWASGTEGDYGKASQLILTTICA